MIDVPRKVGMIPMERRRCVSKSAFMRSYGKLRHQILTLHYCSRCFDVLGFDEYLEGHADGLQILRYNLTTAYIPHMDWFATTDATDNDDYDSAKKGGNRFATILLYMSDLTPEDGGETVFTEAWPTYQPENERVGIDSVGAFPSSATWNPSSRAHVAVVVVAGIRRVSAVRSEHSETRLVGGKDGCPMQNQTGHPTKFRSSCALLLAVSAWRSDRP